MQLSRCLTAELRSSSHARFVTLEGELDLAATTPLRALLARLVDHEVVLDLAGLRFVDAFGLAPLLEAKADADRRGRRFELRKATPGTRRVFELLGIVHLLADPPPRRRRSGSADAFRHCVAAGPSSSPLPAGATDGHHRGPEPARRAPLSPATAAAGDRMRQRRRGRGEGDGGEDAARWREQAGG